MIRSYRVSMPRASGNVEDLVIQARVEAGEVELEEVLPGGRPGRKLFRHDPAARVHVYSVLEVGKRDPRTDTGRAVKADEADGKSVVLSAWTPAERLALYELVRIAHRGPLNFIVGGSAACCP